MAPSSLTPRSALTGCTTPSRATLKGRVATEGATRAFAFVVVARAPPRGGCARLGGPARTSAATRGLRGGGGEGRAIGPTEVRAEARRTRPCLGWAVAVRPTPAEALEGAPNLLCGGARRTRPPPALAATASSTSWPAAVRHEPRSTPAPTAYRVGAGREAGDSRVTTRS